jgi:Cu(I)/Ag(I) efflux system membrane fusion protein
LEEADRVYLVLKGHMRRMRDQLGIAPGQQRKVARIEVAADFQAELAAVWERYLAIQQALAADSLEDARQALTGLQSATATVDAKSLNGHALPVWNRERANLDKVLDSLEKSQDIKAMRAGFSPLSQEIGVLARAFGFGEAGPVYELHCPMAFDGRGAVWYQNNDVVRNPYYGTSMLKCADRVEKVVHDEPAASEKQSHDDHSQH